MNKDKDSLMWELSKKSGKVSGRTAFDAMRKGDKTAKAVVDAYYRYVAEGIADIINMLEPEVIVIGGGISNEGETLLGPVREIVQKESFSGRNGTRLEVAKLGNDAGIIGAAMLK
jgi:glucokinase